MHTSGLCAADGARMDAEWQQRGVPETVIMSVTFKFFCRIAIAIACQVGNGTVKAGDFACDLALPLAINEAVLVAKIQQLDLANEHFATAVKAYRAAVNRLARFLQLYLEGERHERLVLHDQDNHIRSQVSFPLCNTEQLLSLVSSDGVLK